MRKPTFSYANTKTQTNAFVFTTLKHRTIHLKFFSSFCDCTEMQVGNDQEKAPNDQFEYYYPHSNVLFNLSVLRETWASPGDV